jgi:uncharacterized alpha-E superfamily protein
MLSRVAERLYWMARYLERAEDTARLVMAYNHIIMDIPKGSEPGWGVLLSILDANPAFNEHYRAANEQNVLKFLIADLDNVSSIPASIKSARENVRTTRDVLPEEAWEMVNELHLYVEEMSEKAVGRRNRHAFLEQVVSRCQMISGLLMGNLSRDHSYRFIKLGRLLERSDMVTRVIDVGAGDILEREGIFEAVDPLLWGALLQGMSAMGAYRRGVGPMVEKSAVVEFMFSEQMFPRSVTFCLSGIREELGPLQANQNALRVVERARRKLRQYDPETSTRDELHRFIDNFQLTLCDLHAAISDTWFHPE